MGVALQQAFSLLKQLIYFFVFSSHLPLRVTHEVNILRSWDIPRVTTCEQDVLYIGKWYGYNRYILLLVRCAVLILCHGCA